MGISLTQASRLAAVFQVESLMEVKRVEEALPEVEGKEGTLPTPEGRRLPIFDLTRVKALSPEDRKVCYEALVHLREAKHSADFKPENEPKNKLSDERVEDITRKLFAPVEDVAEPTGFLEVTAGKLHSVWKGFLNLIRLRVSTEKLGREIEIYQSFVRSGMARYDELTGMKKSLSHGEEEPGLINKAKRLVREIKGARLDIFDARFDMRNRMIATINQTVMLYQARLDLKAKFPSSNYDEALPVKSFSKIVESYLRGEMEDTFLSDEGESLKKDFAELWKKIIPQVCEEGEEVPPHQINEEELQQDYERLKVTFKQEQEEAMGAVTSDLNLAVEVRDALLEEKALLKAKYHKFTPAEEPEAKAEEILGKDEEGLGEKALETETLEIPEIPGFDFATIKTVKTDGV